MPEFSLYGAAIKMCEKSKFFILKNCLWTTNCEHATEAGKCKFYKFECKYLNGYGV